MISLSAALLSLALNVGATAQQVPTTQAYSPPKTYTFDITSPQQRMYRIFVAEPMTPTTQPLATLVVLDANAMFATAVEAYRFQKNLQPTLIIGIGYPAETVIDIQRRYHDFTPVTADEHIWTSGTEPRAKPENTGGQDEFLDLIVKQVRPTLAKRYPLDHKRSVLFGHSLAGRLVLHALFTRPAEFTHYVAVSPSIWWDDRSLLEEVEPFKRARVDGRISLLVTVGELEQRAAPGTSPERLRFFEMAKMVDSAKELSERLLGTPGMTNEFKMFENETHGSIVAVSMTRAIRFALATPPANATQPANRVN